MTHSDFVRGHRREIASLCKSHVHRIQTPLKCFGKSVWEMLIPPPHTHTHRSPLQFLINHVTQLHAPFFFAFSFFFCSMQFINTLLAYIVAWNLLSTVLGTRQEQGCFIRSCLFDGLATCVPQFPSWLQRFNSGCTTSLYWLFFHFAQAYSSISLHRYSSLKPHCSHFKVCSLSTSVLSLYWSLVTDDSFVRVCVSVWFCRTLPASWRAQEPWSWGWGTSTALGGR